MPLSCETCPVRTTCFAGALDETGTRLFSRAVRRFSVHGSGTAVLGPGIFEDCCYILCEGQVKICRLLENGEEIILDVLAAPAELGKGELFQKGLPAYSVVTISESVELRFLRAETLLEILKDYPAAMQKFFFHLRDKTEKIYEVLACMKLRVRDRLLRLLALHYRADVEGNVPVTVPLSNTDLAQLAQTTPETISRTLQQLRAEGVIIKRENGLLAVKPSVLRDVLENLS